MYSPLSRARFLRKSISRAFPRATLLSIFALPCRRSPRPANFFSSLSHPSEDLFNYTTGRWLVSDRIRVAARRREFDVPQLCRLATKSVGRSLGDVKTIEKIGEGGFNRVFLIAMHDGFELVARIPYTFTGPKFYALASEVATMRFLRGHGLSVPEVYGYDPTEDNEAGTEYIFMEYVKGIKLSDVWVDLEEKELASVLRQMVELESRMMKISFPAGGSLYFKSDLEKLEGNVNSVPVSCDTNDLCIGPDARLAMWYGMRSHLNVNRDPYVNLEEVLVAPARKELAYLGRFGKPLLPLARHRREAIWNDICSWLPICDLRTGLCMLSEFATLISNPGNVIVAPSSDTDPSLKIIGLIDWQHTAVLPHCLLAGIPDQFQNYDDPDWHTLTPPTLPPNINEMSESERSQAVTRHHDRLVYYHYATSTKELNPIHHNALTSGTSVYTHRLFHQAGEPWEGETHDLKASLLQVSELWDKITGLRTPCPVMFELEEAYKTKELSERLELSDENYRNLQQFCVMGKDTWVPSERYDDSKADAQRIKEWLMERIPDAQERNMLEANWCLSDIDDRDYA